MGEWKNNSRTYIRVFLNSVLQRNSCYLLIFQTVWRIFFFFSSLGAPYTRQGIKIEHAKLLWGSDNTLLKPLKQEHTCIQLQGTWVFWTSADLRSPFTFACKSEGCRHRECLSRWPKDYILTKSSTWLTSWSLNTLQQNLHPYTEANKVPWKGCGRN